MNDHPIQPTAGHIEAWCDAGTTATDDSFETCDLVKALTLAAQWGANQELAACHEWLCLSAMSRRLADNMRKVRRSNPMTKKEQALELIKRIQDAQEVWETNELSVVLEVLEKAPD